MAEQNEYLKLINNYATKLNVINHSPNFEEENKILKFELRWQEISRRLKEIKNIFKGFGESNEIGINLVLTETAEGRKIKIHENYLKEYDDLVEVDKNEDILDDVMIVRINNDNTLDLIENKNLYDEIMSKFRALVADVDSYV